MSENGSENDGDGTDGSRELRAAVRTFLADAEGAYGEYDQGYADADATLRRLRSHLDRLRSELPEE